jgi:hypothetical protein
MQLNPLKKSQPKLIDVNIKLIVSSERYGRVAAVSVRPRSDNRSGTMSADEMTGSVVGRIWTRVLDIGASGA